MLCWHIDKGSRPLAGVNIEIFLLLEYEIEELMLITDRSHHKGTNQFKKQREKAFTNTLNSL